MSARSPDAPGAKGPDGTSQDVAEADASTVMQLRRLAMLALDRLGDGTPLEAVAAAGVPSEALQPHVVELRAIGLIEPTGARRRYPFGKFAGVLRLIERGSSALSGCAGLDMMNSRAAD